MGEEVCIGKQPQPSGSPYKRTTDAHEGLCMTIWRCPMVATVLVIINYSLYLTDTTNRRVQHVNTPRRQYWLPVFAVQSIGNRCQLLVLSSIISVLVHVIGLSAPTISHLGDIQIASQHVQSNVTLQPKNLKFWIKRRIQLRGFIITT